MGRDHKLLAVQWSNRQYNNEGFKQAVHFKTSDETNSFFRDQEAVGDLRWEAESPLVRANFSPFLH